MLKSAYAFIGRNGRAGFRSVRFTLCKPRRVIKFGQAFSFCPGFSFSFCPGCFVVSATFPIPFPLAKQEPAGVCSSVIPEQRVSVRWVPEREAQRNRGRAGVVVGSDGGGGAEV